MPAIENKLALVTGGSRFVFDRLEACRYALHKPRRGLNFAWLLR